MLLFVLAWRWPSKTATTCSHGDFLRLNILSPSYNRLCLDGAVLRCYNNMLAALQNLQALRGKSCFTDVAFRCCQVIWNKVLDFFCVLHFFPPFIFTFLKGIFAKQLRKTTASLSLISVGLFVARLTCTPTEIVKWFWRMNTSVTF
jgi:hypothetical protein